MAAPRVAVRTQVPWYLRAAGLAGVLVLVFGLAAWGYQALRDPAGGRSFGAVEQENDALQARLARVERELEILRAASHTSESALQMEKAAQEQLARQIKAVEQENARLKEDLAFFERLAAGTAGEAHLSISRLQVEPDAVPGQLRYRMLLAYQGGGRDREFQGSLQFVVNAQHDGRAARIIVPAAGEPNRQRYNLSFRHFRRVDGVLQIPAAAKVVSVEVRLIEAGATKASQVVSL
jgi:hypothetical protein